MPITRRQFELSINPDIEEWMTRIYDFLHNQKEQAFSQLELQTGLGLLEPQEKGVAAYGQYSKDHEQFLENTRRFDLALERLVELKGVAKRDVDNTSYYAAGRPMKKGEWRWDMGGGKPVYLPPSY
ncbi:MAG: hypothetical protein HY680_08795 [Chloroflexi bacterium]|nr:hypothetical protein [Chloroflexota bacterium]